MPIPFIHSFIHLISVFAFTDGAFYYIVTLLGWSHLGVAKVSMLNKNKNKKHTPTTTNTIKVTPFDAPCVNEYVANKKRMSF